MANFVQQEVDSLLENAMREKSCIEDCLLRIQVHLIRGEYELAIDLCENAKRSLKELVKLQYKHSMYQKVNTLNARGVAAKVVKRSV